MEIIITKRNNSNPILATLLLGILFLDAVSAKTAKKDLVVLNDVKASLDSCDMAVKSLQYLLDNYNISATTTSNPESTTPNSMAETTTSVLATTASQLLSTTNETTESETTTDVTKIITTTSNGEKFTTILTTSNESTTTVKSKTTTPEQLSTTTTKTTLETTPITSTNIPTTVITTPIITTQELPSTTNVPTTAITTPITTTQELSSTTTVPTTIITIPITTTEEPVLPLTTSTGVPIERNKNIVGNLATESVSSWNQNVSDVLTNIILILDEISINPINEGYAADLNVETELLNCLVSMGNNDSTLIEESGIEDLIKQANDTEYIIVLTETIVDDEIKKKQDIRDTNILVAWLVPLLVIIVVVAILCVIYKPWACCCNTSSKSSTSSSQTIHDFPTSIENEKGSSNPSLSPREDKGHPIDSANLRMQYMDRVYKVTPKASSSA